MPDKSDHRCASTTSGTNFSGSVEASFSGDDCPLVVDLDGTLTPADTLFESIVCAIKRKPFDIVRMLFWLFEGRSVLKARVASRVHLAVENLPYRTALLDFLVEEKARGRRIVLATAAHHTIAESVAAHLGLFNEVLASDESINLKGKVKLDAIRTSVGSRFTYAGDSVADLPIWREAESAVLVGASSRVAKTVRQTTPVEREFPPAGTGIRVWLRALRVHQWLKNVLVVVPLLTAFAFTDAVSLLAIGLAFVAFSCAASATYLINDLMDLESDRRHPHKHLRPFASAQISIPNGAAMLVVMLLAALATALMLPQSFQCLLLLYLVLTSVYSWALKRYVLIDVIMLAVLYTLRIVAGSAAVGVSTSVWLLAFSLFIFLGLALVKRCSELVLLRSSDVERSSGRDYQVSDLVVLWPLGVATSTCAVVIFSLFISAEETKVRYETPELLWLVVIGLMYWLGRLWIKTARGEMNDDPMVFAVRDVGSRVTVALMLVATLAAHYIRIMPP